MSQSRANIAMADEACHALGNPPEFFGQGLVVRVVTDWNELRRSKIVEYIPVPAPSTLFLFSMALAGLGWRKCRRV